MKVVRFSLDHCTTASQEGCQHSNIAIMPARDISGGHVAASCENVVKKTGGRGELSLTVRADNSALGKAKGNARNSVKEGSLKLGPIEENFWIIRADPLGQGTGSRLAEGEQEGIVFTGGIVADLVGDGPENVPGEEALEASNMAQAYRGLKQLGNELGGDPLRIESDTTALEQQDREEREGMVLRNLELSAQFKLQR